jgi:3-oxoacyl-[acyl-carrier protein] reductase
MDMELQGKGFLVLGASRGLGRSVARALVDEGARVVVAARRPEALDATVAELGELASGVILDVAEPDVDQVLAAVDAHHETLDGILLNSGGPPAGPALALTDEDWQLAFRLLVAGPLALLRALKPHLAPGAAVLWVTSSSVRQPLPNLDTSNLFRPGIAALVKSLSRDLAPAVRVNSLMPGRFDTDRVRELDEGRAKAQGVSTDALRATTAAGIPLGRYGDPAELGRFAAFLLSPAASYITGTSMQIDGGLVTSVP